MPTPPYVTPPTAVAGQPLPAADWNAKVKNSVESVAKHPRVAVTRATDQLIGSGVVSDVVWSAVGYDTDGFWSAGAPSRLTIPAGLGGLYIVTFAPIFDINAAGARYATISKNGVGQGSPFNMGGFAGWYVQPCVVVPVFCVPGDYLTGSVYQSSGGNLNLKPTVYAMTMSATRVAAG